MIDDKLVKFVDIMDKMFARHIETMDEFFFGGRRPRPAYLD